MCFSPQASFGAAAVLSVLGIVGLKKAHGSKSSLIAVMPCIFAVQQALEGFVWLAVGRGDYNSLAYHMPVYVYLFFASAFWPLYIPLVAWYLEKNLTRKKWLLVPLAAGILVAIVSLIMFYAGPVTVEVVNHHLNYKQATPFPFSAALYYAGLALYLVATSGALFISTIPHAPIMGVLIILALAAAQIWYYFAFGSVWCFFAAICSMFILLAV